MFLYLQNSIGAKQIVLKSQWGDHSKCLRDLQKHLTAHMKGDFMPNKASFIQAYTEMKENTFCTKEFISKNYIILFPAANFSTGGSMDTINQLLGTQFLEEGPLKKAIQEYCKTPLKNEKRSEKVLKKEDINIPEQHSNLVVPDVIDLAASYDQCIGESTIQEEELVHVSSTFQKN